MADARLAPTEDVAATIIALERKALDRSANGDPNGFLEISAPDVVYYDPFLTAPIVGLEALRTYYQGFPADPADSDEMQNPTVQAEGDVAVLTFHYVSRFERAQRVNHWNTTEVYRRSTAGWRIIHTHWALTSPEAVAPPAAAGTLA